MTTTEIKNTANKLNILVGNEIAKDLREKATYNNDLFIMMLNAYNTWQEDENDGVDYIFDIDNKEDTICCLQGGMNVSDIVRIYNEMTDNKHSGYFNFGQNYPKGQFYASIEAVVEIICSQMDNIIRHILWFRKDTKEYEYIISNYIFAPCKN